MDRPIFTNSIVDNKYYEKQIQIPNINSKTRLKKKQKKEKKQKKVDF